MIGRHLLVDFHGVGAERLTDSALLVECLQLAAERCALNPLGPASVHQFSGGGVTAFLVLAESHIAIHTYPEIGYAAFDIFTCGHADPDLAVAVFRERLNPAREKIVEARRGE